MLNALFQLNVIDRKNTSMIYHFVKVKFVQGKDFWPRLNLFLARSIILLSCSSGGTLIPFEYGWSYQKNSNACNFVFLHRFIHKKFRLVRGPVFYPVSGFRTSDGPIQKIFMLVNFFWYTGSFVICSEVIVLKRIFRLVFKKSNSNTVLVTMAFSNMELWELTTRFFCYFNKRNSKSIKLGVKPMTTTAWGKPVDLVIANTNIWFWWDWA